MANGKEAFVKLREAAGVYGVLLDVLRSHKWVNIKLAGNDTLRAAYKLKTEKRSIDVLREAYRRDNSQIPTVSHTETDKPGAVVVAGIVMHLNLKGGRNGSLSARRAVVLYLAEKAKNGTPRQRELAEKILKRYPLFSINHFAAFSMSS